MSAAPSYVDQLKKDEAEAARYYLAGLDSKTEQQKALEAIVFGLPYRPRRIADIACGAGVTSYHLSELLPTAMFHLVEFNTDALLLARRVMAGRNAVIEEGDIYKLALPEATFDLVICWQTLSWLDDAAVALRELVRIARPGGVVLASSLFNLDSDVDIRSQVLDRTRSQTSGGSTYQYNTYSRAAIEDWLDGLNCSFTLEPFEIPIDIARTGRGLGTFTLRLHDGRRLQVSAGMLMNWGILQIVKADL